MKFTNVCKKEQYNYLNIDLNCFMEFGKYENGLYFREIYSRRNLHFFRNI